MDHFPDTGGRPVGSQPGHGVGGSRRRIARAFASGILRCADLVDRCLAPIAAVVVISILALKATFEVVRQWMDDIRR